MKKFLLTLCCLLILNACNDKKAEQQRSSDSVAMPTIDIPPDIKEKTFFYQKGKLSDSCETENEIICAIETSIKCALEPTQHYCDKDTLPDFIFYDDAMFAEGGVAGRPTEQSFNLIKIKTIDEHTIEAITHGECNNNWFGACEGNIIYVLSNTSGSWQVKEIYAIEHI